MQYTVSNKGVCRVIVMTVGDHSPQALYFGGNCPHCPRPPPSSTAYAHDCHNAVDSSKEICTTLIWAKHLTPLLHKLCCLQVPNFLLRYGHMTICRTSSSDLTYFLLCLVFPKDQCWAHCCFWYTLTGLQALCPGFFLELYFREGNCFCGERNCEKHPAGRLKLLVFGGGNFLP